MTASEALKAMEAGKCVVAVKRAFDDPEFNGYFRLSGGALTRKEY